MTWQDVNQFFTGLYEGVKSFFGFGSSTASQIDPKAVEIIKQRQDDATPPYPDPPFNTAAPVEGSGVKVVPNLVGTQTGAGAAVTAEGIPVGVGVPGQFGGLMFLKGDPGDQRGRYPGAEELARMLNVKERVFHKVIKPQILRDVSAEMKALRAKNPNVGIDRFGNIVLQNVQTKKEINVGVPFRFYGE